MRSNHVIEETTRLLLKYCSDAAQIGNEQGLMALHYFSSHVSRDTVVQVYNANPDGVKMLTIREESPLRYTYPGDQENLQVQLFLVDRWPVATLLTNEVGNIPWEKT